MDETKEDMKDVPLLVRPLISPLKVGVDAISIEYGLYNGRFWMPKLQVLEAGAQVGMMRVPVQVEQKFRYASVNGLDSLPAFPRPAVRRMAKPTNSTPRPGWGKDRPVMERRLATATIAWADRSAAPTGWPT